MGWLNSIMVNLKANPFFLKDEDIEWVYDTLSSMDLSSKIGQLFCEIVWDKPGMNIDSIFELIEPAGVMFRPDSGANVRDLAEKLQNRTTIPLLIAGNMERGGSGGNGGLKDGTYYGAPMQIAATDSDECAYRLGLISAREAAAVGINWTFEPVIDIDQNFNNPITNVRTFGSDLSRIARMAGEYIRAAHENGLATAAKHWPGDGIDFRDQHLLSSVNSMTPDEWDATYGFLYRQMIECGTKAVMSAHIRLPQYSKFLDPSLSDRDIQPASLSPELNRKLLRDKLGFNGLIVSDATQMAGFMVTQKREEAVPACIASGCDMFLFTNNHREDVGFMFDGVEKGDITPERLDEAVTRVLALKASLALHKKKAEGRLVPPESGLDVLKCNEHVNWAEDCADRAVTLVKDIERLLPLSPLKGKNLAVCVVTNEATDEAGDTAESRQFKALLEQEGFIIHPFEPEKMPGSMDEEASIGTLKQQIDMIVYYANMRVASNQTSVRIIWSDFLGEDAPKYARDIPTVFISASNPYHLLDVPMVSTYINAYSSNEYMPKALVEKLMGRSEFKGINPVDPFCGLWDTRL